MTQPAKPVIGSSSLAVTKTTSMPGQRAEVSKLYTLADVDPIGPTQALIYGPPGSGKTVLASTFPPPQRWIAADGETSLKSIRWAWKAGKSALTQLEDLVAYTPGEDVKKGMYPEKAQAFHRMQDMFDHWFAEDEVDKWQTLVLDSGTEISEWAMNAGLALNNKLPSESKPLSGSHKINKSANLRLITGKQDYKSAEALFESMILDIRARCAVHGKNLVLLCHEWNETERDEDRGIVRVVGTYPWLHGQLRTRITKDFDDVWYMKVYNGKEFKAQVHESALTVSKTRWGQVFDRAEVNADYREMIAAVRKFHGL